ncbi:MAG: DUF1150 family protein [Alphaproteobacteria bacterium]|jgi:hypothetical protein|nr:DUF1150 family protein [Paracoccaceae bacterium]
MDTTYEPLDQSTDPIVYVRPVKVADLPDEIRQQAMGIDTLYAVHDANGAQLALVKDRKLAFVLARQNHMAPVAVH